jgi:hypothetical protein
MFAEARMVPQEFQSEPALTGNVQDFHDLGFSLDRRLRVVIFLAGIFVMRV